MANFGGGVRSFVGCWAGLGFWNGEDVEEAIASTELCVVVGGVALGSEGYALWSCWVDVGVLGRAGDGGCAGEGGG